MSAAPTTSPPDARAAGRIHWLRLSLLVARRDYLRTVRRRGFIFGTLLLPFGIAALAAISSFFATSGEQQTTELDLGSDA